MKKQGKTIISTKIEVNKDKIYRTHDIHDLAYLIFPNKNARDLRVGFILIFLSIKYSPHNKLGSSDLEDMRKQKNTRISQKTLWKARAVMARIGLIERRDGLYWKFSSRFKKAMQNLSIKIDHFMVPNGNINQQKKEWNLLLYN